MEQPAAADLAARQFPGGGQLGDRLGVGELQVGGCLGGIEDARVPAAGRGLIREVAGHVGGLLVGLADDLNDLTSSYRM